MQAIDWQRIIEKHGAIVWQTAYRLLGNHTDAADCFQETFVCALEVSRRQRVRSFSALLVRLATARAIDQLRKRIRDEQAHLNIKEMVNATSNDPGPAQELQNRELAARLREALAQLPSNEAGVFCMRHFNDMSYRQIAKELRIKTGHAGVLLHRAREKLRNILEEI